MHFVICNCPRPERVRTRRVTPSAWAVYRKQRRRTLVNEISLIISSRLKQAIATVAPTALPRVAHFMGNLGDDLAPEIVAKVLQMRVLSVRVAARGKRILAVGSVLTFAGKNAIVCGAGAIQNESHTCSGEEYILVRGPLTAKLIQGADVPRRFGDPALLAPELFGISPGIGGQPLYVPHYVDKTAFETFIPSSQLLDVRRTSIVAALKRFAAAGIVVASSLHGIILGHAFAKPTIWIEPSSDIRGRHFKYWDYFASQDHDQSPQHASILGMTRKFDHLAVDAPTVDLRPIREAFGILRERYSKDQQR